MGLSRAEIHRIATSAHMNTRGLSHEDKRAIYNYRQNMKTRAKSHKGQERKWLLSTRVPASVVGRIHQITAEAIATGKWPYKTNADTVSDLLIRGLTTLKGDETIDAMLPYLEVVRANALVATQRQEAQSLLANTKTEISEFLGIGAPEHALKHYMMQMEAIEKMPGGKWREWLMKELRAAFPDFERHIRKGGKLPLPAKFFPPPRKYKFTKDEDEVEHADA